MYTCVLILVHMVKLAPELIPLLLQSSRARAIPFFGILFWSQTPPHTQRETGRQTCRQTDRQTYRASHSHSHRQTHTHTH
jgi:hypothetical protein